MKSDHDSTALILEPETEATATVIWLHGLGADGYDFYSIVPRFNLPSPLSVRFIFPHAPIRPVTLNQGTKMRAWYDIVTIDAGAFEDETGIRASEKLIVDLIEAEEKKGIASKNIALAGFSQGGVIALQCGLRYPKPLGGIIALSTYLPLADTLPIERSLVNQEIPVFIGHGTRDEVIPVAWARNSRQILKQHGYTTEWHEYAMGHSVCPEEVRDIALFLERIVE